MRKLNFSLFIIILLLGLLASCSKDDDLSPSIRESADPSGLSSSSSDDSSGGSSSSSGSGNAPPSQAGVITAGEWRDQADWDFWKDLWTNEDYISTKETWEFNLEQRYPLQVLSQANQPVANIEATLIDVNGNTLWKGLTDNSGMVELWADIYSPLSIPDFGRRIRLSQNGTSLGTINADTYNGNIQLTNVFVSTEAPNDLDVFFVVDATGSMGDELEFLKTELLDVINRVKANNGILNVRVGATFYRDEGDDYLTRAFPLTNNIQSIVNDVQNQASGGGGDFPEAVHSGLESAVLHQNWSNQAIAKLVFLVLDAPPHSDPDVIDDLKSQIQSAAEKGIKIIPVVASGINKETEFLMRSFALATNGTYVFITNDSGIGNDHLEPTVGEYDVEYLNNLMVRLIEEYSTL